MGSHPAKAQNKSVISFSSLEACWSYNFFPRANAARHLIQVLTYLGSSNEVRNPIGDAIINNFKRGIILNAEFSLKSFIQNIVIESK